MKWLLGLLCITIQEVSSLTCHQYKGNPEIGLFHRSIAGGLLFTCFYVGILTY